MARLEVRPVSFATTTTDLEITAMTFGPYGVGRVDGKTVMVPNSAPGDRLEVAIVAPRRDYAIARPLRIVHPGTDRREPPCRFLPRCGGCDWQQLVYPAQLRLKAGLIAAEFGRAFAMALDPHNLVEPASAEFGYRSRIRLKTGPDGRVGFCELGTNALVEIDRCLVAAEGLRIPAELARVLGRRCDEIELVEDGGREIVVAHMAKPAGKTEVARVKRMLEEDDALAGVVLRGIDRREVLGDVKIAVELEPGLVLETDADLFSQVNREQNRKLVACVMEMAEIFAGTEILDVFCGTGNFSLPAARRGARVTGVDSDALAIASADANARRMGFGTTQFFALRAVETARFLERAHYQPAVVILDPPRRGAPELMAAVMRMRPGGVVYVSCDPSTLVRDLRLIVAGGYAIKRVRAFDFFPNTHHVELVVNALLT